MVHAETGIVSCVRNILSYYHRAAAKNLNLNSESVLLDTRRSDTLFGKTKCSLVTSFAKLKTRSSLSDDKLMQLLDLRLFLKPEELEAHCDSGLRQGDGEHRLLDLQVKRSVVKCYTIPKKFRVKILNHCGHFQL